MIRWSSGSYAMPRLGRLGEVLAVGELRVGVGLEDVDLPVVRRGADRCARSRSGRALR